jgi:hypothetical protein
MTAAPPAVPIGTKELRAIEETYQGLESMTLSFSKTLPLNWNESVARSDLQDLFETAWRWGWQECARRREDAACRPDENKGNWTCGDRPHHTGPHKAYLSFYPACGAPVEHWSAS